MKKKYTILAFIFCQVIFGQEDYSKYKPVEPLYDNGNVTKFYRYLSKTIDFAKVENEKDVIIAFVIGKDGKMEHIKVEFCNSVEAENEITSILKSANKWDLSNQKDKNYFICYKIKLFFSNNDVKGLSKTMWFKDDVQDIKIDKDEFDKQEKQLVNDENQIFNTAGINVKPEFPGGVDEFYKFIAKNYKTPSVAGLKGKIYVTFVVEKDGSLTDIRVLRDIGYGTGKEAIRVLELCPKWLPGEQDGKKVRCTYSLPISIETSR